MMSVDVTNHNGPAATPPTSLSLRSSHNQLLDGDVTQQGSATPPKCRKKYALTSIQAAMGLGEEASPSSTPASSPSQPSNPKVAKNGVNQLRKAGQDHNRNTTGPDPTAPECSVETEGGGVKFTKAEENGFHTLATDGGEEDIFEQSPDSRGDPERLKGNTTDLGFTVNAEADESDDISILSEKELMSKMKIEEDEDELAVEEQEDEEKNPLVTITSESPLKNHVSSGLQLISCLQTNYDNDSAGPPPPSSLRRASPDYMPPLSVASCSSSSSPETRKDRRTGAKTDCALNRIQNLNPSDEELSWTTLSQESNSPEETGTHTHTHQPITFAADMFSCITAQHD